MVQSAQVPLFFREYHINHFVQDQKWIVSTSQGRDLYGGLFLPGMIAITESICCLHSAERLRIKSRPSVIFPSSSCRRFGAGIRNCEGKEVVVIFTVVVVSDRVEAALSSGLAASPLGCGAAQSSSLVGAAAGRGSALELEVFVEVEVVVMEMVMLLLPLVLEVVLVSSEVLMGMLVSFLVLGITCPSLERAHVLRVCCMPARWPTRSSHY